jgi:uncharacterized membrane protein YbhN (UPF0104 family)
MAADTVTSEVDDSGKVTPTRTGRRQRVLTAVRIMFTVAVLVAVAYTTTTQWHEVKAYLTSIPWESAVLSLTFVLLGLVGSTFAWRAALAHIGHDIPVRSASQIYLVGLLAKYLPGSVWAFVMQMELGRRAGLPRSRAFLASIVVTGISTTTALVIGTLGLPALFDVGGVAVAAIAVLVPVSLVCAHPRVLTWLVQRVLKIFRRPPLQTPITWRGVAVVSAWCAVMWVAYGFHLWLLASSQTAPGVGGMLRSLGAVSLGMTAGMLAFVVPSGLGVREAMIVAALLPYVPAGTALGMALASRMLFIVGDLLAAGFAAGLGAYGAFRLGARATAGPLRRASLPDDA